MNTWLSTTTDMLRSTSIPLAEIAISAKVELRWLYKFKDGYFQDPGVTKVQRIYEFLRNKQGITQQESNDGKECPTPRSGNASEVTQMEGGAVAQSSAEKSAQY